MKTSIYFLIDPRTGSPRYVGITRNVYMRICQYRCKPHSTRLERWFKKLRDHGQEPILRVVAETENREQACQTERRWIRRLRRRGFDLMNHTDGGEVGFQHAPESKEKCRVKNIEHWKTHPRVFSPEWRKKLSDAQKRRIAEGKSNIYELAERRRGKPKPRAWVEKAAAQLRGRPSKLSPERRQEMREAMLHRWQDPEFRKKMHESGVRHTSKPEVMAYLGKRPRAPGGKKK